MLCVLWNVTQVCTQEGTGRIVMWGNMGITNSYTMEVRFVARRCMTSINVLREFDKKTIRIFQCAL